MATPEQLGMELAVTFALDHRLDPESVKEARLCEDSHCVCVNFTPASEDSWLEARRKGLKLGPKQLQLCYCMYDNGGA